MNDAARKRLLGSALIASLAATAWVAGNDEAAKQEVAPADPRARARNDKTSGDHAADPPSLNLDRLTPRPGRVEAKLLFPSQTWAPPAPPPPPPSAAEEAAKRRPPPVPFTYFGGMIDDGKAVAFLTRGNRDYSVKVGDTIDRLYRIEEISEKSIVMTYIPLGERQTLSTGVGK